MVWCFHNFLSESPRLSFTVLFFLCSFTVLQRRFQVPVFSLFLFFVFYSSSLAQLNCSWSATVSLRCYAALICSECIWETIRKEISVVLWELRCLGDRQDVAIWQKQLNRIFSLFFFFFLSLYLWFFMSLLYLLLGICLILVGSVLEVFLILKHHHLFYLLQKLIIYCNNWKQVRYWFSMGKDD